jgi:3-methylcrotonyl-CoA carboxylase alpha subunit
VKRIFTLVRPGAEDAAIAVDLRGDAARTEIGGRKVSLDLVPKADGTFVALFEDGRVLRARVLPGRHATRVRIRGREMSLRLFDPRDEASTSDPGTGALEIVAAMPGRVLEVRVARGDRVEPGDLLVILEAMKMQNEIRAEAARVVAEVSCAPGQAVDAGALLLRFAPDRL